MVMAKFSTDDFSLWLKDNYHLIGEQSDKESPEPEEESNPVIFNESPKSPPPLPSPPPLYPDHFPTLENRPWYPNLSSPIDSAASPAFCDPSPIYYPPVQDNGGLNSRWPLEVSPPVLGTQHFEVNNG